MEQAPPTTGHCRERWTYVKHRGQLSTETKLQICIKRHIADMVRATNYTRSESQRNNKSRRSAVGKIVEQAQGAQKRIRNKIANATNKFQLQNVDQDVQEQKTKNNLRAETQNIEQNYAGKLISLPSEVATQHDWLTNPSRKARIISSPGKPNVSSYSRIFHRWFAALLSAALQSTRDSTSKGTCPQKTADWRTNSSPQTFGRGPLTPCLMSRVSFNLASASCTKRQNETTRPSPHISSRTKLN